MSNLLKDIYSPVFYDNFTNVVSNVIPAFDKAKFLKLIFDKNWENRELKDRMKHTSGVLKQFLPENFEKATDTIQNIITELRQQQFQETSVEFMFFPHYIETFGLDHFNTSIKTFEFVTQFTSCEFAVRPFIIKYKDKMINQMLRWSLHESHHVRRLASEGARPRLPWAIALPELKKNPTPILPILENLKTDSSEYVRRSVANNLNDISKDNPNIVISIAKQWKGCGKETEAIIKHGCRTLLKQGHPEILKYYGLNVSNKIQVKDFKILTPKVKIGGNLKFSFTLTNTENDAQTVRIEFAIYYLRKYGQHSKKVFKISERNIKQNEKIIFDKSQSFRVITTRKFYEGQQKLSIIINGQERQNAIFELI
jgi:3-methyladenine DNA glycosylase AlkC